MRKLFALLGLCELLTAFPILGAAQEVSEENILEKEVLQEEILEKVEAYAEEIEPDANFIVVEKQFSGIVLEQILKYFHIQVTQQTGMESYTLTEADVWSMEQRSTGRFSILLMPRKAVNIR